MILIECYCSFPFEKEKGRSPLKLKTLELSHDKFSGEEPSQYLFLNDLQDYTQLDELEELKFPAYSYTIRFGLVDGSYDRIITGRDFSFTRYRKDFRSLPLKRLKLSFHQDEPLPHLSEVFEGLIFERLQINGYNTPVQSLRDILSHEYTILSKFTVLKLTAFHIDVKLRSIRDVIES